MVLGATATYGGGGCEEAMRTVQTRLMSQCLQRLPSVAVSVQAYLVVRRVEPSMGAGKLQKLVTPARNRVHIVFTHTSARHISLPLIAKASNF